jgi:hypothetical protein
LIKQISNSWRVLYAFQQKRWNCGEKIFHFLYIYFLWKSFQNHTQIDIELIHYSPTVPQMYSIQHYVIKFVSDRLVVFFKYFHQYNWQPRCSWNIVESGVKHHNLTLYYELNIVMLYNILNWSNQVMWHSWWIMDEFNIYLCVILKWFS